MWMIFFIISQCGKVYDWYEGFLECSFASWNDLVAMFEDEFLLRVKPVVLIQGLENIKK